MTNEQKQCLLRYLGYYDGNIDGIWGTKSIKGTKEFQEANGLSVDGVFGSQTTKKVLEHIYKGTGFKKKTTGSASTTASSATSKTGDFWDDIKYFKKSEFKCKCGGKYCNGYPAEPQEKLIRVADRVREHFGKAATVTSGLRCTKHNANEGGVTNSRHLSGKAMDFCVKGVSGATLLAYVQKQPEIRYAYIISGNYVHMDIE